MQTLSSQHCYPASCIQYRDQRILGVKQYSSKNSGVSLLNLGLQLMARRTSLLVKPVKIIMTEEDIGMPFDAFGDFLIEDETYDLHSIDGRRKSIKV